MHQKSLFIYLIKLQREHQNALFRVIEFFQIKGDFSKDHGAKWYQKMKNMENRYQGVWGVNMITAEI